MFFVFVGAVTNIGFVVFPMVGAVIEIVVLFAVLDVVMVVTTIDVSGIAGVVRVRVVVAVVVVSVRVVVAVARGVVQTVLEIDPDEP